jgi:hypothetical protein
LLLKAEDDEGLQADLIAACRESLLFWVNAFAWTFKTMEHDAKGQHNEKQPHVPFITWAIQDKYLTALQDAMSVGYSLLTDKSREMGASWCLILAIHWFWMYRPDFHVLELSYKEELVDSPGTKKGDCQSDVSTLFGKHDYLHNWQPHWLRPTRSRSTRHMVNEDNGSRIDGDTAGANAGTATRKNVVLIDEMAKMLFAEQIKRSLMSVAPCLLPNSTPNGAGTAYSKWRQSGSVPVFVLPWWEHPEKGLNRHIIKTETGDTKITSPWYQRRQLEMTPNEVAIELDMDHIGSGQVFFEPEVLTKHKALYVRDPLKRMSIGIKPTIANADMAGIIRRRQRENIFLKPASNGVFATWCELLDGRPDQTKTYGIGVDISKGMKASNSVASVICFQTREKIAELAIATQAPHEFVRSVVALALWVGGASNTHLPMIAFESNGDPGIVFGRMLCDEYQYPHVWRPKPKAPYGWHSDTAKKEDLLGMYRRALSQGGVINHSALALEEAAMYVYYAGGGIGPATLEAENQSAKKTHGDRVIADALALLAVGEALAPVKRKIETPEYTQAWFMKRAKDRQKKQKKEKVYPRW